jgi:hypothetical protein
MTNLPDDQIDPFEPRLARRVGTFAEQAVRPIDPIAVAAAAHAGARRGTLAGRLFGGASASSRLGVILVGAVLVAAALGVVIGAGGGTLFSPAQTATANVPEATPTSVPGAVDACAAAALTGEIIAWEGAAGHRLATISLRNAGTTNCTLPELLRPALVDADGQALIVGAPVSESAPFGLTSSADATAMVDMANYCGNAPTTALKIRLYLPDQSSVEFAAAANLPNPVDVPPCNGPNAPATIEMQPLRLGTVSY